MSLSYCLHLDLLHNLELKNDLWVPPKLKLLHELVLPLKR